MASRRFNVFDNGTLFMVNEPLSEFEQFLIGGKASKVMPCTGSQYDEDYSILISDGRVCKSPFKNLPVGSDMKTLVEFLRKNEYL